jgi:hypothetical protein
LIFDPDFDLLATHAKNLAQNHGNNENTAKITSDHASDMPAPMPVQIIAPGRKRTKYKDPSWMRISAMANTRHHPNPPFIRNTTLSAALSNDRQTPRKRVSRQRIVLLADAP